MLTTWFSPYAIWFWNIMTVHHETVTLCTSSLCKAASLCMHVRHLGLAISYNYPSFQWNYSALSGLPHIYISIVQVCLFCCSLRLANWLWWLLLVGSLLLQLVSLFRSSKIYGGWEWPSCSRSDSHSRFTKSLHDSHLSIPSLNSCTFLCYSRTAASFSAHA